MSYNEYEAKRKELQDKLDSLTIHNSSGVTRIFLRQDILALDKKYYESNMLR